MTSQPFAPGTTPLIPRTGSGPRAARAVLAVLLVAAALPSPAVAEPAAEPAAPAAKPAALAAGDALPALALRDQHDAAAGIDAATSVLLFTRDMDGGGHVKEALAEGGRETLAAARAVYVSDVSRMPGFVRNAFALPSMRKRAYPVVLDDVGEATAMLPYQEGKVTVLRLDAGRITAVSFASSSGEVMAALQK